MVTTNAASITMSSDITLSDIAFSVGNLTLPTDGPVTLTFQSASPSITNRIYSNRRYVYIGNGPVDDDLTIKIVDNLLLYGFHDVGREHIFLYGKIIGGTEQNPISLITQVNNNEWNHNRVFLMNSNNSFCGDIYIGTPGMDSKGNMYLFLGYGSTKGVDSMLGHPYNRVILRNQRPSLCVTGGHEEGLKRTILGTGTVRGLRVDTQYHDLTYADPLHLGDGSSLEPSVEFSNPVGKITVAGSRLTTDPNSQIVINVTSTENDVVAFSGTSAFTYTGKVIIEPLEEIADGTSWDVMTVSSSAKEFTFAPSYTTPLYSFNTKGNPTDGWTVTAMRMPDISLVPAVQNLSTTLIGETNATVHADVLGVAPDGEATLRVYYGTVDKGAAFSQWEHMVEYPAKVTGAGVNSLKLENLQLNETYYVRHSVENSTGEAMSLDVVNFTTRPWETPDVFTWVVTNANWSTFGAWTIDTPYERRIPGFKGDSILIDVGGYWAEVPTPASTGANRNINITNDVAVGKITIQQGYEKSVNFIATNGPAMLTFDADSSGVNKIYSYGQLRHLTFGNNTDDYGLTLYLKQPLEIIRTSAWQFDVRFYAAIAGGSEEAPVDISFNSTGDQYSHLRPYLLNTNNTFRGDIYIGSSSLREATTMLTVGTDSTMGDTANKIFLQNNSTLRYDLGAAEMAVLSRHVSGEGAIQSTGALHIDGGAVLEPSHFSGTKPDSKITVTAPELTADPDALYLLDLSEDGVSNEKLAFAVSSPFVLTGKLELVPENDTRFPVGTIWDIIEVNASAESFKCALTPPSGYVLTTSGDSEIGWTVSATSVPTGTTILIR